ncbi:unnamed protein product [Toxocara canis]|uniref:Amine oxidase n=1 Tax=Toxocara canis TaxID=6265 RepID=A0A183VEV1_TOXCA|nr:unnamed protein product [Toxocara canis]
MRQRVVLQYDQNGTKRSMPLRFTGAIAFHYHAFAFQADSKYPEIIGFDREFDDTRSIEVCKNLASGEAASSYLTSKCHFPPASPYVSAIRLGMVLGEASHTDGMRVEQATLEWAAPQWEGVTIGASATGGL